MVPKRLRLVAQSAMEYLMTYGWAILIVAVVLAALFELGVFNGSNLAPQACIAQSGFVCKNPVYTSNGITFTFGQTTGRDYYGDWVFVASQGEALNPKGVPAGFSTNTAAQVGGPSNVLISGQLVQVDFPANDFQAGGVPSNPAMGTPFVGYVWLGYCLSPCSSPTAYSKVATLTVKSSGSFLGSTTTTTTTTTTTSSSSTSTTTTTTTSTTTTSVYYIEITLAPSTSISGTFQQLININPSSYSSACGGSTCISSDLGNMRFYQSLSNGVPSGELYSWLGSCNASPCGSSTSAELWIKLPNGESSSGTVVYMVFEPTNVNFDGNYAGAALQLDGSSNDNIQNVMEPGAIFQIYYDYQGTCGPPSQNNVYAALLGDGVTISDCEQFTSSTSPFTTQSTGNTQTISVCNGNIGNQNNVIMNYQQFYSYGAAYPDPPVPPGDSSNSWIIKMTAFVDVPTATTVYGATDDAMAIGYSSTAGNPNGQYWLGGASNPNNIVSAWYNQCGAEHQGNINSGDYALEMDYEENGGGSLTALWSGSPISYYHAAYPPNGEVPSVSFSSVQ